MTKLKNQNYNFCNNESSDNSNSDSSNTDIFSKNNLTLGQPMRCSRAAFCNSCDVLFEFQGFEKLETIKTLTNISPNTLQCKRCVTHNTTKITSYGIYDFSMNAMNIFKVWFLNPSWLNGLDQEGHTLHCLNPN